MIQAYPFETQTCQYIFTSRAAGQAKVLAPFVNMQHQALLFLLESITYSLYPEGKFRKAKPKMFTGALNIKVNGETTMVLPVHSRMLDRLQFSYPIVIKPEHKLTAEFVFADEDQKGRVVTLALHGTRLTAAPEPVYRIGTPHKSGWVKIYEGADSNIAVSAAPSIMAAEELVSVLKYRRVSLLGKVEARIRMKEFLDQDDNEEED